MYSNLRFFRGLEYDLNFEQNTDGVFQGIIHLPEVSSGLYETANLFILEECRLYADSIINLPVANTPGVNKFSFAWEESNKFDSTSIIMYDIV